ncbi:toprim domain-containing protein [Peribacillus sp. SCS-155]|uniref:toprim domain-containing protein n=1 Tax=Peribacillus sedimenti TaxID=3115297 RepID=UPI00390625F1
MEDYSLDKVIIVEGTSDKRKVNSVLREPIQVICTNGTISLSRLDELVDELFNKEVYILVDADDSGEKLRKQFKRELPEAIHLYIDRMYREVATAPANHIATVLLGANIDVNMEFVEQRMI